MNQSSPVPSRKSIGTDASVGRIYFHWYREPHEPKLGTIFEGILDSAGISNPLIRAEARQEVKARIQALSAGLLEYPEHVRDLTSNPHAALFELRWSFPHLAPGGFLLRLYECEPAILGATVVGLHLHRKEFLNLSDDDISDKQQAHIEYAVGRYHQGKATSWGLRGNT